MRYIFTLCCALVMSIVSGQEVLSSTYLKSYEKSYFTGNFGLFSSYDVDLYRVKYTTIDVKGNPTVASGLVCLPSENNAYFPILAYQHGTVGSRFEVPSYGSFEAIIPSIFTSMGFVSIAPDYLGLGDSPGIHPYVHAESEATASRDLLIAAEKFMASKDYKTNKNLFFTGYSQGGHASMAFHRMMEANDLGYKLKAASHMSGPYSISSGMKELLLSDKEYSIVAYMAEVALSYNLVYGIFPDNDMNKFFKPTYAKLLQKFADEELGLFDMNTIMVDSLKKQYGKALPKKMLLDNVLNDIVSDDNHPVNVALRANDVYDWKPTIPTRLLYCTADEQVAYTNSIIALEKMKANGATNVTATDVRTNASHTDCVNPAVTNTLFFFLQYLNLTEVEEITSSGTCLFYPNPANDRVMIASNVEYSEAILLTYDGKTILKNVANQAIDISDINAGLYIILLKDKQTGATVHGKIFKSK